MNTISIIGLGWLGMPLAQALQLAGFQVKGSKTSSEGVQAARLAGIAAYQLKLSPKPICDYGVMDELLSTEVLIITLPASRTVEGANNYFQAIQLLVDSALTCAQLKRIIFTSSTSVYGDNPGTCDESTPVNPSTIAGKTLVNVEQWLHGLPGINVDILRLAGLVGADRHPGRFLAGKKAIANGNQGVNLVHLFDVIKAIQLLLTSESNNRIFNICAEKHPARAEYYPAVAQSLGLAPPEFLQDFSSNDKIVSGNAICHELGFRYQFSNPYQMLPD